MSVIEVPCPVGLEVLGPVFGNAADTLTGLLVADRFDASTKEAVAGLADAMGRLASFADETVAETRRRRAEDLDDVGMLRVDARIYNLLKGAGLMTVTAVRGCGDHLGEISGMGRARLAALQWALEDHARRWWDQEPFPKMGTRWWVDVDGIEVHRPVSLAA